MPWEQTASCYRVPAFDVKSYVAYTNVIPSGHMRSPGGPQVTFAVESHLNVVAAELGMDAARTAPEEPRAAWRHRSER